MKNKQMIDPEKYLKDNEGNVIATFSYLNSISGNYKSYENLEVYITHKGKKNNERDLDLISDKVYEKRDLANKQKSNILKEGEIQFNSSLSENEKQELRNAKKKMEANSWLSRQRSLRRSGKLEQYKIDRLNQLGMLWNPKKDPWEIQFSKFKKYRFIDEIEDWVKEQRELHKKGLLNNENNLRLNSINFPFEPELNEQYEFTTNSIWQLKEKLRKKIRRLELKLIKNPPKKLTEEQKQVLIREKEIQSIKKKNKENKKKKLSESQKLHRERDRILGSINRAKYWIPEKFSKTILTYSEDKIERLLEDLLNGQSIFKEEFSLFYDSIREKRLKGKYKTVVKLDSYYRSLDIPVSRTAKYNQLNYFNTPKINIQVRLKACNELLNYYDIAISKNLLHFKPLNFLISFYKKQKDYAQLEKLREYVNSYPVLTELYLEKL